MFLKKEKTQTELIQNFDKIRKEWIEEQKHRPRFCIYAELLSGENILGKPIRPSVDIMKYDPLVYFEYTSKQNAEHLIQRYSVDPGEFFTANNGKIYSFRHIKCLWVGETAEQYESNI